MMLSRSLWKLSFGILIFVHACTNNFTFEQELWDCAAKEQQIRCQRQQLATETEAIWDGVVSRLTVQLPADMPQDEKRNMLAVRNANLIRMFEVYETFNDSIKQTVDVAEKADQQIVNKLAELQSQLEALENKKRTLFLEIEEASVDLAVYKSRYEAIINEACK